MGCFTRYTRFYTGEIPAPIQCLFALHLIPNGKIKAMLRVAAVAADRNGPANHTN